MMQKSGKGYLLAGAGMLVLFVVFTVLVCIVDVQPIGPEHSMVGFATLNGWIFGCTGQQPLWYGLTEMLGIAALACAAGFGLLGLVQLVQRRSLLQVDRQVILLGVLYVVVIGFYVLFEQVIINYRPVILEGSLEASYPSSHTMLVVSIMASGVVALRSLYPEKPGLLRAAAVVGAVIAAVTIIGRMLCGVHWFTDIVGGVLLSAALVLLYAGAVKYVE